ncbi:hypothetical protein ACTXT7_005604 [Hymenolepis weldensis]
MLPRRSNVVLLTLDICESENQENPTLSDFQIHQINCFSQFEVMLDFSFLFTVFFSLKNLINKLPPIARLSS